MYQDMEDVKILVVDNYGCDFTKALVQDRMKIEYIRCTDKKGTAPAKEQVIRYANTPYVMCMDCHVLLYPDTIAKLKQYFTDNPDCKDILQGPMVYDDLSHTSSHMEPTWSKGMWGQWANDKRAEPPNTEPFEVWGQGMGVFAFKKSEWPGFSSKMQGFGAEEGYIQTKFRSNGGRCLCMPWLKWVHRFHQEGQPVKFSITDTDRLHNYLVAFTDAGLPIEPVLQHFSTWMSMQTMGEVARKALHKSIQLEMKFVIGSSTPEATKVKVVDGESKLPLPDIQPATEQAMVAGGGSTELPDAGLFGQGTDNRKRLSPARAELFCCWSSGS